MYRKTFIEINTDNLKSNVRNLINNYSGYEYYFGVVKGNAYGHGYKSVKYLTDAGINYLAVSSLEEAIGIRNENIDLPILCLQPIHIEDVSDALKYNVTVTLSSFEYFKKLITLNFDGKLKVHLKINSGFNRLGVNNKEEVFEIINALKSKDNFLLEGIYSHFATTGVNDKYWDNQLVTFNEIVSLINLKEITIVHLGRSLTLLNHKKIDVCNGVRIGITAYGYGKSMSKQNGLKALVRNIINKYKRNGLNISETMSDSSIDLSPAFSLYSEVIEMRKLKKGDCVGYGAMYEADIDSTIAVVSIGYADGFMKSNVGGFVAINNKKYRILSIDMGMITVLVDDSVNVYDKVELIGQNIHAKEVADRNETSVYEILCSFKESIPRVLIENKQ